MQYAGFDQEPQKKGPAFPSGKHGPRGLGRIGKPKNPKILREHKLRVENP